MVVGKLKYSLKERCPFCGSILQLRVLTILYKLEKGIDTSREKEIIVCSNQYCDYKEESNKKRGRVRKNKDSEE